MPDLELTRDPADRRRYVLEGVGSLRVEGFARRRATIEAGGRTWQAAPIGFWRRGMVATDAAGETVAEFEPRRIRSGGALRVGAREFELAPASNWKQRYALKDGDDELAVLEAHAWGGRRPVRVTVADPAAVEPLVLLLAAFLARRMAEDASATAASTA